MARRIGIALLAALGLLAAGAAGFVALNLGDPPIDDADLRPAPAGTPPGENGIALLDAARKQAWWPEADGARLAVLLHGGDDTDGHEALAAELLRRNEDALALVRRALDAPHFALAPLAWDGEIYAAGERPEWLTLARVLAIGARVHARAGRAEEAFEAALAALRLGQRLRSAQGATLTAALLGLACTDLGLAALDDVLADLEPEPEQARRWSEALAAARVGPAAWRAIWSVEYQGVALLLDRIARGEGAEEQGVAADPWRRSRYFFKPNATKALFASLYRTLRDHRSDVCGSSAAAAFAAPDARTLRRRALLAPNGAGEVLFWTAAPAVAAHESRPCSSDARLVALLGALAQRARAEDHAALSAARER